MTPDYWEHAKLELSTADPVMGELIVRYSGESLRTRGDAFYTLARSIVGQQISVKAADSVWGRVETLLGEVTTQRTLALTDEDLRGCGLSRQKITYLRAIAGHFEQHNVRGRGFFEPMNDDEVIRFLTEIKGVGRWTAEMFLIFNLMRPNVFPIDDIGLQKAIELHYEPFAKITDKKEKLAKMAAFSEVWRPWRTLATWYLWRALDPVPVEY